MSNPYEILGVSPDATDEEIKNAYREKARMYQEDKYQNGPLSGIADKKMQELDNAYDAIIANRRSGASYSSSSTYSAGSAYNTNNSYSGNSYSQGSYTSPTYAEIRNQIKKNNLDAAQDLLDRIHPSERIAEWYYLQGMVQQKKGWANAAFENYQRAYQTDSSNPEYARAYQSMNSQRSGGYRTVNTNRGSGSECSFCNICQGLICADCCCECMGGDLIPCC